MKYRRTQGVSYSLIQLEQEVKELEDTHVWRLFQAMKEKGYLDSFFLEMNFHNVYLTLFADVGCDIVSLLEEVEIPHSRIEGGLPQYQNTRAKLPASLGMLKFVTDFDKMCFLDKARTDSSITEFTPIDLYYMGGINFTTYID